MSVDIHNRSGELASNEPAQDEPKNEGQATTESCPGEEDEIQLALCVLRDSGLSQSEVTQRYGDLLSS